MNKSLVFQGWVNRKTPKEAIGASKNKQTKCNGKTFSSKTNFYIIKYKFNEENLGNTDKQKRK